MGRSNARPLRLGLPACCDLHKATRLTWTERSAAAACGRRLEGVRSRPGATGIDWLEAAGNSGEGKAFLGPQHNPQLFGWPRFCSLSGL